jgi:pSer/pThr/pTyr-binding forkhead associated (FHA) protein
LAGETYRLIVRRGPQPNQTFDLTKDIITLGRDITNDIVINDPEVSRHHLRFTRGAEGYNIEDLGSTNGTFVGGQRLSGVRALRRGDMIGLGETVTLSYDLAHPSEAAAGPAQQQQYAPPPQQQQQPVQPAPGYQQPDYEPQPSYEAPPPPDYGYQQDYGYGPQAPGYDYDPYAIREEEPQNAWRWVIIGCASMVLFCCCATVMGMFIIDQADLWCDVPIFSDIVTPIVSALAEALGIIQDGGC